MKLVIDLQGAQGTNRNRGIGRLTRALARAMIAAPRAHEPVILLNDAIPESAEELSDEFSTLLPRENIRFWRGLNDAAAIGGPASVERRKASERIRAHTIAALGPDAVHVSSVFEGGADDTITNWPAALHRPPHVATFYDAIPLINREQYLRGSWGHLAEWYLRQVQEVRRYDGLLAISESSGREAVDHLGFGEDRVFNIRAGFDSHTFGPTRLEGGARATFLARYNLREGYLLFIGAGDPRKNELGLLQAYGLLPHTLRAQHQLVIVGAGNASELLEHAASLGLQQSDLQLPRHVAEQDLAAMYASCGLFIMPSKHEGFGLPALEAMACGAPVIASNTTSLPEVVGLAEALFDPHDPASIAERILAALQDDEFRIRLAEHGRRRASEFTWEESARRAWVALEALKERGNWTGRAGRSAVPPSKARLALLGGLPARTSESARLDLEFISELARHYDVTLFTRAPFAVDDELGAAFANHLESELASRGAGFDRILYRLSRSDPPTWDELLSTFPGVVIRSRQGIEPPTPTPPGGNDRDMVAHASFARYGWRAIAALHRGEPLDLLQPATLYRDAMAVIDETDDFLAAPRAFAERCRARIEDAYIRGVAAQRHACVRALAGHAMPGLARALVQNFPTAEPEQLLLDLTCIEDRTTFGLALREEVRRALVECDGASVAEIVSAEGEVLRFARARAAAFLGLPLHGLADEAVAASPADTYVFLAGDTEAGAPDAVLLRSLRHRGARVIAIVLGDPAHVPAGLSAVDGVICATEERGMAVLTLLEDGRISCRHTVGIGWPLDDGELLRVPPQNQWPLCWHPVRH